MSRRAKIRLAVVAIVAGLLLLILKVSEKTSPTNNPGYDRVIQLIQAGQLKPPDVYGGVVLPSDYAYLSVYGSISEYTLDDTPHVFFTTSIDKTEDRVEGYLYKENDVGPNAYEFQMPYAGGLHCDRLKPKWFDCTFYFF